MKSNVSISFSDWCRENNRMDLLNRWDYKLNNKNPEDISYKSNAKYYFKCPRGIHESQLQNIQYFAAGKQATMKCTKCESFAQFIIDNKGYEYFKLIWNCENIIDPWVIAAKSNKKAIFNCLDRKEHVYEQIIIHFSNEHKCPYCTHQKIFKPESIGVLYPISLKLWSCKNKKTPFDYYPKSGKKVWWRCENGIHDDYERVMYSMANFNFKCPKCIQETRKFSRGVEHPLWKGTQPQSKLQRRELVYFDWRNDCYNRDKYICQCCGYIGRDLRCHHIKNFSSHIRLRTEVSNGITLCNQCHDVILKGSFHNTYGTSNNTPEQLEEYINKKRKQLGIDIPFNIKSYLEGDVLKPQDI